VKLCIDLDGCLYPWVESLRKEVMQSGRATREQLPEPTKWEFWDEWGLTYPEFKEFFTQGVNNGRIFRKGIPAEGGVLVLKTLKAEGHGIHIISNRSIGWRSMINTAGWLCENEVPFDSVTLAADKTLIKTDIAIDDYIVNLQALRNAGTRAVCFDQPWNQGWSGERVSTWMQFYRLVSGAEQ
jgi:5'(3')-deoxyribonucleotidase